LSLDVHAGTAPADWDARLLAAGGTVFHSRAWADYTQAEQRGTTALYITLRGADGGAAAMALAFLDRSRHRLVARITGSMWLDSYPVVTAAGERDSVRLLLQDLVRWAKHHGVLELSIGSFASPQGDVSLADLGFSETHRLEFELAVQQTDDALSSGLEYKRRKNLNKARRLGVQIVELDADAGVAALRRMQAASSERIERRGGPRIGRASDPRRDPVRDLLRHGVGRLIGAVVDGEVVSASLFTRFGSLVYHTLSGHGPKALETQAPTLLIWETIRRYRDEGAERFNFGGCSADAAREDSPEHGVYVYKRAFGADCIACTSGHAILRPALHWAFSRARSLFP
jgi:CelD/BcsL family acetyltransferase involved in cellulose biosynthesis